MDRRDYLKAAAGVSLASLSSAFAVTEPYERAGGKLMVGLAAYSFRNHFPEMKGKPNSKAEGNELIDMPEFIRFCAANGVAGAELTSYFFPADVDKTYLSMCRQVAHLNGIAISGTAVGNNFSYPKDAPERAEQMDYVKTWIDYAQILGAPHIRVFAGKHPKDVSEEEAETNAMEALAEAGEYAGDRGIFLGIENHDSIGTADRLLRIVKGVDSPWVGVNLDSGNFRSEDPYADMAATAGYAVNVQLKTELKIGEEKEPTDFPRVINILRDAGYAGYVVLEYEEDKDPFTEVPPIIEKLNELCA